MAKLAQLEEQIERIISIQLWQFEGLPEEITTAFNELLHTYSGGEIMLAIEQLMTKLKALEAKAAKCAGNSGMAGEYHMAIGMQLYYLKQCLDLIVDKEFVSQ